MYKLFTNWGVRVARLLGSVFKVATVLGLLGLLELLGSIGLIG